MRKSIAWAVVILLVVVGLNGCGGGGGGSSSSGSTPTSKNLSTAAITVDGNTTDWNGVDSMLSDVQGDKLLSVSGGDLKAIYLAKNGNKLFVRFDVWTDTINQSNHYRIWFDNNKNNETDGDVGDRQIDVYYSVGSWHVAAQSMQEPYSGDINVNGVASASGSTLEASVDLDLLGISNSFILDGVIRDQNWNNVDWSDSSVVVNNQ